MKDDIKEIETLLKEQNIELDTKNLIHEDASVKYFIIV